MMTNEEEIRRLIAAYSDAVWRLDRPAFSDCWAEDGVWKLVGLETRGREQIVAAWVEFMKNFDRAWQTCQTIYLDIGEERGTGRIYVNETVTPRGAATQTTLGIYHDEYVKEGGRWVFARRHFDIVYAGPPDFSGRFFDPVPYGSSTVDPDPSRPAYPPFSELSMS